MPEGPEIRRAADQIAEVLVDEDITQVRFGLPRLRRYAKLLRGHRVVDVETRGKAMLTHFDHGYSMYSHNQLYGLWRVVDGHKLPKTTRSMRVLLQTASHSAILYSASDISVMPTGELSQHPFLAKIGPDIMNTALIWREVMERLQSPRFSRRELAALYLDQAFLAGNGNYLRSEILHDARIDPRCKPAQLTRGELGRLARSTLTISRRSYDTGGITLNPRLAKRLARTSLKREQRRFYAYGRTDQPCYHCGGIIRRSEANSRGLYYCSVCQNA
ncbi:endonuclease VIII [Pseudohalioglobus lutimaris]|uniref:DNA-(apurinic or apyrimidinic site) lyase n=1 Tax=Pseudohalioglobus lutimaris TaxID=1737061 RepID=A0A2N5X123_9GAMM|nr:endonuclease VIII [Pseudohalioglobus lutimaris]PLW68178.1 endonuclease VIII [Pseudohalioglobus lutimaris]